MTTQPDNSNPENGPIPSPAAVSPYFNPRVTRELEWRCPACGSISRMGLFADSREQLCLARLIHEHIQEGCKAYEHTKPTTPPIPQGATPRSAEAWNKAHQQSKTGWYDAAMVMHVFARDLEQELSDLRQLTWLETQRADRAELAHETDCGLLTAELAAVTKERDEARAEAAKNLEMYNVGSKHRAELIIQLTDHVPVRDVIANLKDRADEWQKVAEGLANAVLSLNGADIVYVKPENWDYAGMGGGPDVTEYEIADISGLTAALATYTQQTKPRTEE